MKTAERHHLQENEVALALGHANDFYSQNKTALLGLGGALLAAVVGLGELHGVGGQPRRQVRRRAGRGDGRDGLAGPAPGGPRHAPAGAPAQTPGTFPPRRPSSKRPCRSSWPPPTATRRRPPAASRATRPRRSWWPRPVRRSRHAVQRVAGGSDVVGHMAALGKAEAQLRGGKYNAAIASFKTLSERRTAPSRSKAC